MNKPIKLIIIFFSFFLTFTFLLSVRASVQDVKVGFSPRGAAKQIVLSAIKEAKKSIDVAAYSFTSKPIALALVNAQQRGVNVRVVADKRANNSKYTAITYLANHRVLIRLNDKYAIMHNKFMIVDDHSVETGSFNYTQGAISRNAENVIYILNRPDIAKKYIQEFDRLWSESAPVKPNY